MGGGRGDISGGMVQFYVFLNFFFILSYVNTMQTIHCQAKNYCIYA